VCKVANLPPVPDGYGMLSVVDESGAKITLATSDVDYVRAIAETGSETLSGMEIQPEVARAKFLERKGWPDDWV
jgi:hypothetical protein